ncbi:MAG: head GIN domain-containing protein [Psychroserpens sp.]|uniref:head GIN domain-containing protein n=1 Tax=Psychroserpens sp. TaxID=2020870 RepID=UPI00300244BC
MTTLVKFTVAVILSLMLMSCNFDMNFGTGVKGNGNVSTVERNVQGDFNQIEVSRGLDVYLTQSDSPMLKVQADENLHDIIITEIENGILRIYAEENISYAQAQKVMVNVKDLNYIISESGSDLYSTNTIIADNLKLVTTSGADMDINIEVNDVTCISKSGSDLKVSGTTNNLTAEASSGSDLKAGKLKAQNCVAEASSGADITVYSEVKLRANANSGGDIKYYGNPKTVKKSDGVSGDIRKM